MNAESENNVTGRAVSQFQTTTTEPIRMAGRVTLLVAFFLLTLPIIPLFAVSVDGLRPLLFIDLSIRAVPLFVTWIVDGIFFDGGEVTPHLLPLWVVLTGIALWPLLVLGVWPGVWFSPRWRQGIWSYSVVMLAATIGAAFWVFTHLGIFFQFSTHH